MAEVDRFVKLKPIQQLVVLAIGLILGFMLCKSCGKPTVGETTTTIDTLYQDTGTVSFVDRPVPYAVNIPSPAQVDSFFIAADIDTLELMADYFATRSYAVTYDTNEVKVSLRFDVHRNALKDSLRLTVSNVRPTQIITNTTTVANPKRLSLGLSAGFGYTPKGWQPYIGGGLNLRLITLK